MRGFMDSRNVGVSLLVVARGSGAILKWYLALRSEKHEKLKTVDGAHSQGVFLRQVARRNFGQMTSDLQDHKGI
ncbi:hypothetical protein CFIMG_002693RAa [Ceratocystis fimbriata CBS 114723]|uniref:Uncharacterized protein n=1 Tax=Ceratocystis fimbriata CBS 114723 TaxID=1035309 RepID=A0A2C5X3A4_9PEZI|nr:hypothetical protein CFIMG_002693RAa [Ceratocystis fimbriata CBS 114723]